MEGTGIFVSLQHITNPLTNKTMKKYYSPKIQTGKVAIYSLSVALESWIKFIRPQDVTEDKPQMLEAAKIIHQYLFLDWCKAWE